MSDTARRFTILRNWCDWQDEISALGGRVHRDFPHHEWRLRLEASYLIGYFA